MKDAQTSRKTPSSMVGTYVKICENKETSIANFCVRIICVKLFVILSSLLIHGGNIKKEPTVRNNHDVEIYSFQPKSCKIEHDDVIRQILYSTIFSKKSIKSFKC